MNGFAKRLIALPAVAVALVAVMLVVSALTGGSHLPAPARSLTDPPRADGVVLKSADESVVVTRDWQEVTASPKKR